MLKDLIHSFYTKKLEEEKKQKEKGEKIPFKFKDDLEMIVNKTGVTNEFV